jgi:hypothetical protein
MTICRKQLPHDPCIDLRYHALDGGSGYALPTMIDMWATPSHHLFACCYGHVWSLQST